MKNLILLLVLSFASIALYAQTKIKFYQNGDALREVKYLREHPRPQRVNQLPKIDSRKLIDEDNESNGLDKPFRFGKDVITDLSMSDGSWTNLESGRLWSIGFKSEGAYSLNFTFDQFKLSENSELYISNSNGTMLYGPVTAKQNPKNGFFLTDLIQGDEAYIYLYEPTTELGKSKIVIKKAVHAYRNLFSDLAYGNLGGSETCNNDIACFPAWDLESDAVALVLLSNGTELCSGSLMMTADQSFEPYLLSAFHCIDTNKNGSISAGEQTDAENWLFKFQYKMTSCAGSTATAGVSYNGATFRAAWNTTDFVLMEMNNSPVGDAQFSWLGWDRTSSSPTKGSYKKSAKSTTV